MPHDTRPDAHHQDQTPGLCGSDCRPAASSATTVQYVLTPAGQQAIRHSEAAGCSTTTEAGPVSIVHLTPPAPGDCSQGIHGDRLRDALPPMGTRYSLHGLAHEAEMHADESLNPLFRRAYKHLADAANYVRLLEEEARKPCC